MTYDARCKLAEKVSHTIGTQCLIYLFDPGQGWIRDSNKRADMLIMTAKLVEKGVSLKGLSYYGETIEQTVQDLADDKPKMQPPAICNDYVKRTMYDAGYTYVAPELEFQEECYQRLLLPAF